MIPPGPKGSLLMGVMRDFNRDTLGFVTRCRDYGDVVHTRFLYVHAYFLYNPADIESILTTNAKSCAGKGSSTSGSMRRTHKGLPRCWT